MTWADPIGGGDSRSVQNRLRIVQAAQIEGGWTGTGASKSALLPTSQVVVKSLKKLAPKISQVVHRMAPCQSCAYP